MLIRKLKQEDAQALSEMIALTLRTTNAKDYSEAYLEDLIRRMQPDSLLESAAGRHFYVAEADGRIVGSGAVGPYHGKEDESCLYTVFVHPDFQGKGVGRRIMETIERDEYFQRARRVEVPASLTAVRFYLKLGYTYKNGVTEPDEEQLIRLEKRRQITTKKTNQNNTGKKNDDGTTDQTISRADRGRALRDPAAAGLRLCGGTAMRLSGD